MEPHGLCGDGKIPGSCERKLENQKIDPQGLINRKVTKNHFWSDRTFCEHSRSIQVDLTVNGKSFGHAYYNDIFQYFPRIKKLIEKESAHLESGMIAVDFKI